MQPRKGKYVHHNPRDVEQRLVARGLYALARLVAYRHHAELDDVLSGVQTQSAVRARDDLYSRLFARDLSYREIGRLFGRDRTTVYWATVRHRARAEIAAALSVEAT